MSLYEALAHPPSRRGLQRGLFPLGLISGTECSAILNLGRAVTCAALQYANGLMLALNWLYDVKPAKLVIGGRSAAQKAAVTTILRAALALHDRLASSASARRSDGWSGFERGGTETRLGLIADAVDVPESAGACDLLQILTPDVVSVISSPAHIFPSVPDGLHRFSGFYAGERGEYIALTVRQLRAGLLELAADCVGGGTVFPVGKRRDRQRLVWHGTQVSRAAARPPPPRHLANPAVFGFLELEAGQCLRVSKRDCCT